jgi:galactitol-specific phosphotransferase system IIB component
VVVETVTVGTEATEVEVEILAEDAVAQVAAVAAEVAQAEIRVMVHEVETGVAQEAVDKVEVQAVNQDLIVTTVRLKVQVEAEAVAATTRVSRATITEIDCSVPNYSLFKLTNHSL